MKPNPCTDPTCFICFDTELGREHIQKIKELPDERGNVPSQTGGRKDDGNKLRFDLFPVGPLRKLAEVYTIGARKYSPRNWEKGIQWGRIYSALQRHANAWWGGERNDPVDGQHHLASVAWCALTLMEYEHTHPELDDRKEDK